MLSLLPFFSIGQVLPVPTDILTAKSDPPSQTKELVVQADEVRALPGQLDKVPLFTSNSPEVVQTEGILLSTFPPGGKAVPHAHLNMPLRGNFNLLAHHAARANKPGDWRQLYLGVIVYNPGLRPVTLDILQGVSYLNNPDAPFIELPPYADNSSGKVYAGPGSRVMTDILRGIHQSDFPSRIVIPARQSRMLLNVPIGIGNSRSTFMRLRSNESVYMASLAMYARPNSVGKKNNQLNSASPYRPPLLAEWQKLLTTGNLAGPRDRIPTHPEQSTIDNIIYGRVAGVAQGSEWRTEVVDSPTTQTLNIPGQGKAFSYPISTLSLVTLGTSQVQSAPMLVRYPDTAYRSHGNYGVYYSLTLPLFNNTNASQTVTVTIQTPLKQQDRYPGLLFLEPPDRQVFFRGTVQVSYSDQKGLPQTRYVHLVQRRGEQGEPLVTLKMKPGDRRLVKVDFLYPPDSLPPQVLTVKTLGQ